MATITQQNETIAKYGKAIAEAVIRYNKTKDWTDVAEAVILAKAIRTTSDWTITGR